MEEKEKQNFSFTHDGKIFWYSRSMTGVSYVFCYDNKEKDWCIAANQRGPKASSEVGKYNAPCGYMDFNERICYTDPITNKKGTALRETFEENGITFDEKYTKFYRLNTNPHTNTQNADCSFYTILPDDISNYQMNTKHNEEEETSEVLWIHMKDLNKYDFAFNQKPVIYDIYNRYINISWFRKQILRLMDYLDKKYRQSYIY